MDTCWLSDNSFTIELLIRCWHIYSSNLTQKVVFSFMYKMINEYTVYSIYSYTPVSFQRFLEYRTAALRSCWFNYQPIVHPHQANYVLRIGQCVNQIEFLCSDDLRWMWEEGSAALQAMHKMGFYPLVTIPAQLHCLIEHNCFCHVWMAFWTCLHIFTPTGVNGREIMILPLMVMMEMRRRWGVAVMMMMMLRGRLKMVTMMCWLAGGDEGTRRGTFKFQFCWSYVG